MTPYIFNTSSVRGDENIIVGRKGQTITMTSLNISKATGAYTVSLIMAFGSTESTLWTYDLEEGDTIECTTPYVINQSCTLKISSTPGINLTVIGEIG